MFGFFSLLNVILDEHKFKKIGDNYKNNYSGKILSRLIEVEQNTIIGYHKNKLKQNEDMIENITLCLIGVINNYDELSNILNIKIDNEDNYYEYIIYFYKKYGIEQTLNILDGMYSFILFDKDNQKLYVINDYIGIHNIYVYQDINNHHCITTELKNIKNLYNIINHDLYYSNNYNYKIVKLNSGTYTIFNYDKNTNVWKLDKINVKYHNFNSYKHLVNSHSINIDNMYLETYNMLNITLLKNNFNNDLVSLVLDGDIYSGIICYLIHNIYKTKNKLKKLEIYSLTVNNYCDLKKSKFIADFLKIKYKEIVVDETKLIDIISKVICKMENYKLSKVRKGIEHYIIYDYIENNSLSKNIVNNFGSMELFGNYLEKNDDTIIYDKEIRNNLNEIQHNNLFNLNNNLNIKSPYYDKIFINYYLSIHPSIRNNNIKSFLIKNSINHIINDNNILKLFNKLNENNNNFINEFTVRIKKSISNHLKLKNIYDFKSSKYDNLLSDIDEEKYYKEIYDNQYL